MSKEPSRAGAERNAGTVTTAGSGHTPALIQTNKSIAQLEMGIAHYPEPIRTPSRWMQGFYLDFCRGNMEALRGVAAKLGFDKSREYFRNLICGDYFTSKSSTWKTGGGAWNEFLEMISALRRYEQASARVGRLPFVPTPTYYGIANFITDKRSLGAVCKIGGIIAPTGGQTSESFKFYKTLNNHGAVTHLEAPSSGKPGALKSKILEQYHLSGHKIERRADIELRANVNESRCIIIDNAQVLYNKHRGNDQPCFNLIRELYDDCRPTFILKFTEDFFNDLAAEAAKGYFEQFMGRMGGMNSILRLPQHATEEDLRCIAATFKLQGEGAYELLFKWSRMPGRIRIVFDRIQRAHEFARADGAAGVTLDHLHEADHYTPAPQGVVIDGGAA